MEAILRQNILLSDNMKYKVNAKKSSWLMPVYQQCRNSNVLQKCFSLL